MTPVLFNDGKIEEFAGDRIEAVIMGFLRKYRLAVESCLDVGCGRRPADGWFRKIATGNVRFTGSEVDPVILQELRERGVDAVNPFQTDRDLSSDLVLAKEVLEHIHSDEALEFLQFCKNNTRKVFALTTPNFECWPGLRASDRELRWVPDHFSSFSPESSNPHAHKLEVTPALVASYLAEVFDETRWEWTVYRAWPWRITDLARGTDWTVHFKVFALAWRKSLIDPD